MQLIMHVAKCGKQGHTVLQLPWTVGWMLHWELLLFILASGATFRLMQELWVLGKIPKGANVFIKTSCEKSCKLWSYSGCFYTSVLHFLLSSVTLYFTGGILKQKPGYKL